MRYDRLASPVIARIFRGESVSGLSEWQLLERYLERRDEVAFEALVARHGPMVLGVCRRMLPDNMEVEDAFQATFLVLVRRARQLGPRDAIGPWLYGVAARVAMRARSEAARRRRLERLAPEAAAEPGDRQVINHELGAVLDDELSRLPSKYRSAIVLCYLQGQTHEEAARLLQWPIGTVKGRLARARDLLRARLIRRGLTLSISTLMLALCRDSRAALHRELLDRTVKTSLELAIGQATAQVVSASIASLVEGVLTSMFMNTLKWSGLAVTVSGLVLTGAVVMARQDGKPQHEAAPSARDAYAKTASVKTAPADAIPAKAAAVTGVAGELTDDRLPDLRRQLVKAAQSDWSAAIKEFMRTSGSLEPAYQASKRLMEAQDADRKVPLDELTAVRAHSDRIKELARVAHTHPSSTGVQSSQLKVYAAEVELRLAEASARVTEKAAGAGEGVGKDAKSKLILARLNQAVAMPFFDETPLEDVLKYIKQSTTSPEFPSGIPIYVDPVGLQEAEKSMTSTVRNMDLEGVPLRRTLQLLLKQIDLIYFVDDGLLCITSSDSESGGTFGPATSETSPILLKAAKAERGELSMSEMRELIELFKTREQVLRLAGGREEAKHVAPDASHESNESKQHREQMDVLLKGMRELVDLLKAEIHTKKAAATK
jgi:RNA polymerase sigma factor (sigma-70 family)